MTEPLPTACRLAPSAGRVLVVLANADLDGDLHGLNAWPASGRGLATHRERESRTKQINDVTAAMREDARRLEQQPDSTEPYP